MALGSALVVVGLVVGFLLLTADRTRPAPAAATAPPSNLASSSEPPPTTTAEQPVATTATTAVPTTAASTTAATTTSTTVAAPATAATDIAATGDMEAAGDAAAAAQVAAGARDVAERYEFGTSVNGQPLVAWRRAGSGQPTRRELVVGVVHGEEPAGRAVVDLLLTTPLPADLELWLVPTLNPDGEAVGQRGNANGVDLNRNFPTGWLPPGSDPYTSGGYHSGSGPASEPEVRAAMALIRTVQPQRTVWYHQPWDEVLCEIDHAGPACTAYAARTGQAARPAGRPGSAIGWQQAEGLGAALVVELADGPLPPATAELHAAAVLAGW